MEHHVDMINLASQQSNGNYVNNMNSVFQEVRGLFAQGYTVVWSANGRWCEINGKTYNIPKSVFEARLGIN